MHFGPFLWTELRPSLNSAALCSTMAEVLHQSKTTKPHVAVLAFPFGAHAAALLNLTRRLAVAAPDVTFSFFSTAKSNCSVFGRDHLHDNIRNYDVADGIPAGDQLPRYPVEAIGLFLKASPDNFKKALEEARATSRQFTCVLSDAFLWFAADIADELGVPWVPLWTAGLCSLSTHYYTDFIRHMTHVGSTGEKCGSTVGTKASIVGNEDQPLESIPGLPPLRVGDLPEGIITGNLDSPFASMLCQMGKMLPRAAAVVVNSFRELEPTIFDDLKSKLYKCLTVGPFAILTPPPSGPDETGCLPWLDQQRTHSVVYLSFGTMTTPQPEELAAIAEGLEAKGAPFLWSLREKFQEHLPTGFVERTRGKGVLVPWAPQKLILEHPAVGVFVSHCGWNSVTESIAGGVPMVYRPLYGDQKLNGRMVSDVWRIGVEIEGGVFTRDGVVNALDLILSKDEGTKIREKVGALSEIEKKAVGPGGSSTENFKTLVHIFY
ncbi:PREDICTED: anthocyanidin 3-O-glucosyltransferase 7-like [Nelumbo nucifera]|nr:PREDICTED: anthocyanidin 3-O-glucosyltransferase 7-like [Nelumbo nucifera]